MSRIAKRLFDISLALVLVALVSPLIAILALLIRINLGTPVLFRQARPGRNARIFFLVKFRTMTDACDANGSLLSDDLRLTPLGRWLRSFSLDELPQLWNVLRGELSFVGPRPLLVQYLPLYTKEQARRHEVPPGITGWAQVNGRNAISWEQKFALDIWYVDHWSIGLDFKILWLTLWKVLSRDGISSRQHVTMPEFTGNSAAPSSRKVVS